MGYYWAIRPFEFLWVKIYSLCKIGQLVWRMLRPNYTKDLDLFRACSSYFLSRPAAIEIGRRVEHNHNIRINEPMPKHILERIAGPNVVRVQEYVESAGRKEIVKLQRSCSGFHPPIAHKNPSLSTK
ncbi:hypothetical protein L286_03700 [Sphingobium sp. HDIP04]|nr:hypothetical protein L286_04120 [Sphingobium sp. HDIP04]EQB07332.1 hypothetical protein L286_03995 [Sphingobium sp. HDIP04]EQB07435.1 hypothetical protein L286_03700 [Sphingobium sp. HDIP04]